MAVMFLKQAFVPLHNAKINRVLTALADACLLPMRVGISSRSNSLAEVRPCGVVLYVARVAVANVLR